ncbi:hypothetical protein KFE98_15495 [bacterium SCSIO 12741]|nr:hypothetical protein KFE98_15495 [bacterium SCSIO 12741]
MKILTLFFLLALYPSMYLSANADAISTSQSPEDYTEWTTESPSQELSVESLENGDDDGPIKPFHQSHAKKMVDKKKGLRKAKWDKAGEVAVEVLCVVAEVTFCIAIELVAELLLC